MLIVIIRAYDNTITQECYALSTAVISAHATSTKLSYTSQCALAQMQKVCTKSKCKRCARHLNQIISHKYMLPMCQYAFDKCKRCAQHPNAKESQNSYATTPTTQAQMSRCVHGLTYAHTITPHKQQQPLHNHNPSQYGCTAHHCSPRLSLFFALQSHALPLSQMQHHDGGSHS